MIYPLALVEIVYYASTIVNCLKLMVTGQTGKTYLAAEALDRLKQAGLSIPQWAKANGFKTSTVKAVLYGYSKGIRGEAYKVAIALGIKDGVIVQAEGFKPVRRTKVPLRAVGRRSS